MRIDRSPGDMGGARKRLLFCGLSAAALLLGGVAQAQTASPSAANGPAAGAGETTVGEVVVEATKREARLQDVPESVAVITGAALTSVGPINNSQDVLNLVPGARFNNLADPLNSEISVRGSGTERATGADSSVGLYFDNVYVGANQLGGRNLAPIDSFDLDHVEVLEGPQGALYGRDAEFGVVNLLPQKPTFSNSGYVDDTFTSGQGQNRISAVLNYRINDNWAVRLGAEDIYQERGFEFNPDTNTYYDHTSGYMLRAQVRFQKDRLDVDLLAERQQLQVPSFWSEDDIAPKNAATGYPGFATLPQGFVQDPRVIPHNGLDYSEEDIDNFVLSVDYDFGWAKATSTTSWRDLGTIAEFDADYSDLANEVLAQQQCKAGGFALTACGSYPFTEQNNTDHTSTWYEDMHLDGAPLWDKHLTWLAGLELMDQQSHGFGELTSNPCPATQTIKLPGGGTLAVPTGMKVGDGVCVGPPPFQQVAILPGSIFPAVTQPGGTYSPYSGDYFSWAPYASLGVDFGYGLKLNGDVRYSHDRKTATSNVFDIYAQTTPAIFVTNGQPVPQGNYLLDKGNFTYAVTLSWRIPGSDNDLLYTKVGTGYRVGGFNLGHTPPLLNNCTSPSNETGCPTGILPPANYAPVQPNYSDENSISYEVGLKGNLTRHAYFSIDAYWEQTKDALAAVGDGCTAGSSCLAGNSNYTVNAGETRGWGVEGQIDSQWNLFDGKLNLQLDASTQTAKYVSEPSGIVGLPLVGTPVAENPKWVASVLFGYTHPITEDLRGFLNFSYHGQWGGIQDPVTTAGVFFPLADYQDVDLKTGVDFKHLELAFIVTNLTNETHVMAEFEQVGLNTITKAPVAVVTQQRWSLPRTLGLEATYKW